jgi:uncharacterized protein
MSPESQPASVVNNEAANQFEIHANGELAFLTYRRFPNGIILQHTEVPASLEGRGLGGQLARAALELARAEHLAVIARCPFVTSYIQRHPEYASLLAKSSPEGAPGAS